MITSRAPCEKKKMQESERKTEQDVQAVELISSWGKKDMRRVLQIYSIKFHMQSCDYN